MIAKITVIDDDGKEYYDEVKVKEVLDFTHNVRRCFVRLNFSIALTKEDMENIEKMYAQIAEALGNRADTLIFDEFVGLEGGSNDVQ